MVEKYKLLKTLEKYPYLRSIIEKIQKDKKIKLAILFGSYAKGLAKQDSDIDIYIDTTNKTKKELEALDTKLSIKIGKFNSSSLLAKEIIKNHIILKGVEEFYEKNNLFD
jgi:predicted nucleotidyltransferase